MWYRLFFNFTNHKYRLKIVQGKATIKVWETIPSLTREVTLRAGCFELSEPVIVGNTGRTDCTVHVIIIAGQKITTFKP